MSTTTTPRGKVAGHPMGGGSPRVAILIVTVLVAIAAAFAVSGSEESVVDSHGFTLTRAQLSESARLNGLAEYYADKPNPAQAAEAERWTAMAEAYNRARAAEAEAARWRMMGEILPDQIAPSPASAQRADGDLFNPTPGAYVPR